jgi:hypothetical protein
MTIVSLPLPITLLNGTVADAGQVMTDLNAIASNVNANAAKNGVNSDITSLTALISVAPGLTITGASIFSSSFNGGTIVGSAIDSTTTGITQGPGTNTTQLATTAFVINTAFASSLPAQVGNAGKFVTTNGLVASWSFIDLTTNVIGILPIANGGTGGIGGVPAFLLFAQGVI